MTSAVDTIKWIFVVVCLLTSLISGIGPMKLKCCRSDKKIMGLINTFSGGVFLGLAFFHMIPETANLYYTKKLTTELQSFNTTAGLTNADIAIIVDNYTSAFPLPFLIVVFGYAFILMVDRVVIDSHHHAIESEDHNQIDESNQDDKLQVKY